MNDATNVYNLIGEDTVWQLTHAFYRRVADDAMLRPMFRANLATSERRLGLFLIQYFGGPSTYSDERGHPRLRLRHNPFQIDRGARDAWVGHMHAAMDEIGISEPARSTMHTYFEDAATFLINHDGSPRRLPVRAAIASTSED